MSRGPIGARLVQEHEKSYLGWITVGFVIILAVGGLWYYLMGPGAGNQEPVGSIASGEYQAVFLDNGQVYFGKLKTSRGEFYTLTDVFYLQSGSAGIDQTANLSLTKLGSEAHGPEDRMQINVEHVLFVEDMKNDSKVVQAIQSYKSSKQ